ncbi:hypothetical protein [Flavobacterium sp.]|uniref:hypothetical protein n=1 Tax=Flavobacterium sp. TaxID=239 RepID=UPI00286DB763|nr:hypothetical protein [Flavobacterium sp.]
MKTICKSIFGVLSIALFFNCSEPDDIYMGSKDIKASNLIQIETLPSYKLNDLIYINSSFSRYLPEEGYDDLLDIYKTTKSNEYSFEFLLEKKSAYDTWTPINIGNKIVVNKGKSYTSNAAIGVCVFNPETNLYEFRAGIPLLETGEFRLRMSSNLYPVYTNSSYISVYIYTTISQVDNQGNYHFTVN